LTHFHVLHQIIAEGKREKITMNTVAVTDSTTESFVEIAAVVAYSVNS